MWVAKRNNVWNVGPLRPFVEDSSGHQVCKVANTVSFLSLSDQIEALSYWNTPNSTVGAFTWKNHFFQDFLPVWGPNSSCSQEAIAYNLRCAWGSRSAWEPGTAACGTCMPLDLWAHPIGKGLSVLAFFWDCFADLVTLHSYLLFKKKKYSDLHIYWHDSWPQEAI